MEITFLPRTADDRESSKDVWIKVRLYLILCKLTYQICFDGEMCGKYFICRLFIPTHCIISTFYGIVFNLALNWKCFGVFPRWVWAVLKIFEKEIVSQKCFAWCFQILEFRVLIGWTNDFSIDFKWNWKESCIDLNINFVSNNLRRWSVNQILWFW